MRLCNRTLICPRVQGKGVKGGVWVESLTPHTDRQSAWITTDCECYGFLYTVVTFRKVSELTAWWW